MELVRAEHTNTRARGSRWLGGDANGISTVRYKNTAKGRKTFKGGSVALVNRSENETQRLVNAPTHTLFTSNDTESLSGGPEDTRTGTGDPSAAGSHHSGPTKHISIHVEL